MPFASHSAVRDTVDGVPVVRRTGILAGVFLVGGKNAFWIEDYSGRKGCDWSGSVERGFHDTLVAGEMIQQSRRSWQSGSA